MKTLKEKWQQVEGFERYLVSNTGRVISTLRNRTKELKAQPDAIGYLHYRLYPEDKRFGSYANNRGIKPKLFKSHRLVAETFIPNGDTTLQINHKDGDKHNNNVDNLEYCTAQQNIQHSWDLGIRKHTHEKIAQHNRKPIVAIHTDGTKRYFQSRMHLMFGIGCSRPIVSRKLIDGKFIERGPAKGYSIVNVPELPIGEKFEVVPDFIEKTLEFNRRYFYKHSKKIKQNK